MNTVFGKKIKQTQGFLDNGTRIPVTVIAAYDAVVTDVKSNDKHGYSALQLGVGTRKKGNKALLGHVKKSNLTQVPFLMQEVRLDEVSLAQGDVIKPEEVLRPGDIIDVTGVSKGKGFAGGVKRYHFRGGPRTHGQSDRERAPGSIGQTTTPGRVYKGKKMAGNMGRDQVTVKNLVVVDVNPTLKTILVKGLVPGILKSTVEITKVGEVKEKNFVPLLRTLEETPVEEVVEAPVVETPVEEPTTEAEAPVEVVPAEEQKTEETIEDVTSTVEADETKTEEKEEVK